MSSFKWQAAVLQAENSIPGVRLTTAYLGNVPISLSDDLLEPLLRACGPLRRWKRPLNPTGFLPKPFGFAEFSGADGLLRCSRVLTGLPLAADLRVTVKLDEKTTEYLDKFQVELSKALGLKSVKEIDFREEDRKCLIDLIDLMTAKHMHLGKEFIQGLLSKMDESGYDLKRRLDENDKENETGSSSSSNQSSSSSKKPRSVVLLKKKLPVEGNIDWTGFEEKEQRYLQQEAIRLQNFEREAFKKQIESSFEQERINLMKRVLSEVKDV
jgi:hypothetical protein